jgi:hypothetical protein
VRAVSRPVEKRNGPRGHTSAGTEVFRTKLTIVTDPYFTPADLAYLNANYRTLAKLCEGRSETPAEIETSIAQRRLPRPSYVLDDGTGMFPHDYFRLVDEAGGVDRLAEHFLARYEAAALENRRPVDDHDNDWDAYLDGTYGICLRQVSPATIVRKGTLVSSLSELLMLPRPSSDEWRDRVREQVDELDQLESEFAPDYDRAEWNERPPTRDLLIRFARHHYPNVFAGELSHA